MLEIGRGVVRVQVAGDDRFYANHELARLAALVAELGPQVLVQERWSLMRLKHYLVSIRRQATALPPGPTSQQGGALPP